MATEEQVYGVVAAWEEARERGCPVPVEGLSDDPAVVAAAIAMLGELYGPADPDDTRLFVAGLDAAPQLIQQVCRLQDVHRRL